MHSSDIYNLMSVNVTQGSLFLHMMSGDTKSNVLYAVFADQNFKPGH